MPDKNKGLDELVAAKCETQKLVQSYFFNTLEEVVEYQAQQAMMLSEPQNLVDDDAVCRTLHSPKSKEADRLARELQLSELIDSRFDQLYAEEYGQPLESDVIS